jgi:hypothetical protein
LLKNYKKRIIHEDAIERSKNYIKELQYWWHITDEDLQKEEIK